jgi:hypothetical protein
MDETSNREHDDQSSFPWLEYRYWRFCQDEMLIDHLEDLW